MVPQLGVAIPDNCNYLDMTVIIKKREDGKEREREGGMESLESHLHRGQSSESCPQGSSSIYFAFLSYLLLLNQLC